MRFFGKDHTEIVLAVLMAQRKKTKPHHSTASDQNDLFDVLKALRTAGYTIVPRGALAAMRKLLAELLKIKDDKET